MTNKRIIDVDTTDRADGKVPVWDTASSTHVYVAASGSVAADTLWDAKGDDAVGTGANTAVRLAVGANGTVKTAASGETTGQKWAFPPGYELDYIERTSDLTTTQACGAGVDTIATGAGFTADGSSYIAEFYSYAVEPSATAGRNLQILLYEDGSSIGTMAYVQTPATGTMRMPVLARRKITPSAGSHTYSVRVCHTGGAGKVYGGAGGSGAVMPTYLRITKA